MRRNLFSFRVSLRLSRLIAKESTHHIGMQDVGLIERIKSAIDPRDGVTLRVMSACACTSMIEDNYPRTLIKNGRLSPALKDQFLLVWAPWQDSTRVDHVLTSLATELLAHPWDYEPSVYWGKMVVQGDDLIVLQPE